MGDAAVPGPECRFCGRAMDHNTAAMRNGVCEAPECDTRRLRESGHAILQREWDQYRDQARAAFGAAAPALDAMAEATGSTVEDMTLMALPHQTRPMVAAEPGRQAAMVAHLEAIVAESFAGKDGDPVTLTRERIEAPEGPFATAACSTCKGHCCALGASNNAFLSAESITQFRRHNPDMDAEQVLDAYVDRLAGETPEGSCVFHGARGCTLDRTQRSDICNRHYCRPMVLLMELEAARGADTVALVAHDQDGGTALATFSAGAGWSPVEPAEIPAIPPARARAVVAHGLGRLPETSPMITDDEPAPVGPPRTCRWCGQEIGIIAASTSRSCGAADCERQRVTEMARAYSAPDQT